MPILKEGHLEFTFPTNWIATQYDTWPFYKNQFKDACGGNSAVDFLAFDPTDHTLWLIEVKDYRQYRRTKPIHIWDEMALKLRDTLAGLITTKINGSSLEKQDASTALKAQKLRFILHLEQPKKHSKLFPRTLDLSKIQGKLRQLLKPIDAHPKVVELGNMAHVAWRTASVP